jgi:hypothetical protein
VFLHNRRDVCNRNAEIPCNEFPYVVGRAALDVAAPANWNNVHRLQVIPVLIVLGRLATIDAGKILSRQDLPGLNRRVYGAINASLGGTNRARTLATAIKTRPSAHARDDLHATQSAMLFGKPVTFFALAPPTHIVFPAVVSTALNARTTFPGCHLRRSPSLLRHVGRKPFVSGSSKGVTERVIPKNFLRRDASVAPVANLLNRVAKVPSHVCRAAK